MLDNLKSMIATDGDPSELFAGLQRHPEDVERPLRLTIPMNSGNAEQPPVPVVESNHSGNQVKPLVPSNREQEVQSQIYTQDIQVLDPLEHLREAILVKVSLTSHETDIGNYSSEDLSTKLEKLGKLYFDHFHHQDELDKINKAMVCYSCAVFIAHEGHPKLPKWLERLCLLYITRFQHSREPQLQDHEKAAYYLNRSFTLAPQSRSDPSRRLSLTALLYECRFWRTGDPVYGAKAIQDKTEVISMTRENSPELPIRFESLGMLHEAQFQRTGHSVDINKAIEYLTQAIKLTPNDPRRLEGLGISYRTRSLHIAPTALGDIEKALANLGLAVECTPEAHGERPRRLANLGVAWEARFRRLGDLHDNEQAIRYKEQAVDFTAEDDPDLPIRLESLGVSYETRFQRLGQLDDIETAIQRLTRAVDLTPQNDLGLSRRLDNLGTCHAALFERVQCLEDSRKSIEYLVRAVQCTPDHHPDLPRLLNNLGMAYRSRFERDRDGGKKDIENAIKCLTQALDITNSQNDDHPDLPLRLDNLGVCYRTRFDAKIDTELEDLRKAIECGKDAVSRMPDDHVGLARQLTNLGISHEMWYEQTKSYIHLTEALDCFRQASQIIIAPPRERFRSARHWARLLPHSTLPVTDYLEAYRTAIDLVPHMVLLGTNTRQRYHDLRHQVSDLGVEAASMAIRCGKNNLALEWLEQTRCVIWNQTLLLRSEAPLVQLRTMYPHFKSTDRLQKVIDQLYHSSLETDTYQINIRTRSKRENTRPSLLRSELINVYDGIISEVRKLPGFKDFLQPKRASELIGTVRRGPMVVINCHNSSCDALIIRPESKEITGVSLPGYTFAKAQSAYSAMKGSLVAKGMRERGAQSIRTERFEDILASLWEKVVKPVLTSLGYVTKNSVERLPHITWCPTGIMTFLPLHAAGDYKSQPPSRVFDYVISSYTPTLTAMPSSNSLTLDNNCGVIAICQPDAKLEHHLASLPGTATELAFIRDHTRDKLKYSELVGPDATTENVLKAMSQNNWVHLACHARQDINDPDKSCFFLHESTLDLATIARQPFKNKGLAFLSACQTASGDDKLPDEAAHLASCMLVAGYPSVIASMWSVKDDDAPFVADHVYSHLMNCQSIANGEVARALHNAVAMLRERVGMMKFDRWVQYIHMGL
ncbi:unnamed protein product [Rhizoctonia solani]|uniref:CHAT domain-containing protein n=1 Tax=Rhizoctonia solani TaxID=456999 RepID=A0A8H3CS38_9AGAM|nr:unnamed protein product [Rhizoctonia solani]CAE6497542.1 unnamed protein product [Rhizoctonia solani]